MPYIKQEDREDIDKGVRGPEVPGELAYVFYTEAMAYWEQFEQAGFTVLNDIVGALESAKAEFQRRVVAPYEDQKIQENGDIV